MPYGSPRDEPAYTVYDGDGPAAVFIHGFLAGDAYWQSNLPALRQVCQPVVIELFGHGRSPSPDDRARYEPPGLVAALERLRVHLGHDRWFVVGHSLGTAIALHYALAVPERVTGLVITNSRSAFALDRERMTVGARKQADRIEAEGMAAFDRHPLNPHYSARLTPAAREGLIEVFARHDPAGLANTLRWTTPNAGVVDRLADVEVPTLLTWGIYEKAFDPGLAVARERIADLRIAELHAGHPVNLSDQVAFDRAVSTFITDLR